jgi:ATP-dependent DNA helicase PIF1
VKFAYYLKYPTGTGKSVLLRAIIELHRLPNGTISKDLAITASTGIAGLNIGGTTLHSFAGVGLGKGSAQLLAARILGSKRLTERWTNTKTLIIDESMLKAAQQSSNTDFVCGIVSMLDAMFFDKLVRTHFPGFHVHLI